MNNNFFTTIQDNKWSLVHKRCLSHDGDIVDLGCIGWDWSHIFIGKKRVVGVDPQADQIHETVLFKGAVSDRTGFCSLIQNEGINATIEYSPHGYLCLSWNDFINLYKIDKVSVLKINIEGSEYPLINSLTPEHLSKIDQIAVSFHHFVNPDLMTQTQKCLKKIENNDFEIIDLEEWGWYLCLNRQRY